MKRCFLLLFTFLFVINCYSQVGIGTTNPNPAAILDILATEKGIIIPRIILNSISQASLDGINIAPEGLLIYNVNPSATGGAGTGFYYYNGSLWEKLVPQSKVDQLWKESGGDIERQSGDVYIGNTNGTNNDLYLSNALIDWDDPNYRIDPAALNKVNEMEFDDGSAGDPSIRFDDTTTGFFSPNTDQLAYSINSTERLRIDASGNLGVNTLPQARLDVNGTFRFGASGTIQNGMASLTQDFGMVLIPAGGSYVITTAGTSSLYGIPQQSNVSVSFETDMGPDVSLLSIWMEPDATGFRLYNKATTDVVLPIVAHWLFVW